MRQAWHLALALSFGLAHYAPAEDLQKQIDELKDQVDYIRHNYEPAEPVEEIKQVTEWVSPSGELFTERQKGDISPTDGSPLTERVTYRKMKFARREAVADKIAAAIQGNVDGHIVVGLNVVGVYQNLVGAGFGNVLDSHGNTRSANRGAGTGQVDLSFAGKPMLNTVVFVDLNSGVGPGLDALAPNTAVLNANYLSGGNTPTVREAWVAFRTPRKIFSLQAGVVDLSTAFDTNLIANDETSQFLTGAFVNSPLLANPANGPGLIARFDYNQFSAKIAAQNSLASATDITDSIYSIAELGMRYHFLGDGETRIWGRQQPRGSGQPDDALGLSTDHRWTPQWTTFGRYAKSSYVDGFDAGTGSHMALNKYDWTASAGLELGNFALKHLKDRIGLAYGRNDLQSAYGSYEDFTEIYYKTVLTTNFSLSLHGQSVFDRVQSGGSALPNIFALGLRTQISY
jgi:hypothetical protein